MFFEKFENSYPFADGNGRTGSMILFRECLNHYISPIIVEGSKRLAYLGGLQGYREKGDICRFSELFAVEQEVYDQRVQ